MSNLASLKLAFIGAGKVGTSLALAWQACGIPIVGIHSQRHASAQALAQRLAVPAYDASELPALIRASDLVFLTVPDDAIAPLAHALSAYDWQGVAAIHTSGAHGQDLLSPLLARGAHIASLHPALPFAQPEANIARLHGASFALETSSASLAEQLQQLVQALQGHIIHIPAGKKAQYHAALVFASNYGVTLYAIAEKLMLDLGADKTSADNALNSLLSAMLDNLRALGVPEALTGPIVRADLGTLERHRDALQDASLRQLYRHLAQQTLPLAQARGIATDLLDAHLKDDSKWQD